MLMGVENTASLPMLLLSRRHQQGGVYVDSRRRAYPAYVHVSASTRFGHEDLSHGPLFSAVEALDQRTRRPGAARWSLTSVVFQALLMVLEEGQSLNDRFINARACYVGMFPGVRRPGKTYQGFIKRQREICPAMVDAMMAQLRDTHRRITGKHEKRFGWTAFACDGSRVEAPRTSKNQAAFGCAGKDKTGPQLALTTLYHMGTGLPWNWRIGAGTEAERSHLRAMLRTLPEGALIVADAGFTGYDLLNEIIGGGRSFLIRAGSNVRLLTNLLDVKVQQNGDVVWLWPQGRRDHPPLTLRLIRLGRRKGSGSQEQMCLLTNVFDRERMSPEIAASLYEMRWGVEVFYRAFKRTLDQHKLRSDAPEQAKWELQWAMMAFLLLGLMTVEGILERGRDPLSMSVAGALRVVRQAMRHPQRCWRRRGDLRVLLAQACKDEYVRTSSKKARDWPHKKKEGPPGLPQMRPATEHESRLAERTCAAA